MAQLAKYIERPSAFLQMPIEERARLLLAFIVQHCSKSRTVHRGNTTRYDTIRTQFPLDQGLAGPLADALTEAWIWLERELLIVPDPDQDRDWVRPTSKGLEFVASDSPVQWAAAELLQRDNFDPELAADVGPPFRGGRFTKAVADAFQLVEHRIRLYTSAGSRVIQPFDLMGSVFAEQGALRIPAQDPGEANGVRALFQGAMGCFRAPYTHRNKRVDTAEEALRLIQFAELLLRIAKDHRDARQSGPPPGPQGDQSGEPAR